jgi:hypothetical protein
VNEGPIRGLLGRDEGSEVGNIGCRDDLRPSPVILPSTLKRLEVSDRADSAGDGGVRSGKATSGMEDRQ